MLSSKIDLTENRDFGGGRLIAFDTPIEIPLDEYQLMSSGEYEHIIWQEGIFGRKRHNNEKDKVFNKELHYINEVRTHCERCGAELRIPWKNYGGVCKECDDILSRNYDRIPWKISIVYRDPKYDLFNSR